MITGKQVCLEIGKQLKQDDFVFGVDCPYGGPPYDVYRFVYHGHEGRIAFRFVGERFEIGLCKAGILSAEEIFAALKNAVS